MHFIITQGYLSPCLRIITQGYGPECSAGGGVAPFRQRVGDIEACVVVSATKTSPSPRMFGFETICFKIKDKTTVTAKGPEVVDLSDREVTAVQVVAGKIIVTARLK